MPDQDALTGEAITLRTDGRAEFIARDVPAASHQHAFSDFADFKAYLGEALGAKAEGEGIRGSASRRGEYSRRAAEGGQAAGLGDRCWMRSRLRMENS
jgi:hypothetical protein